MEIMKSISSRLNQNFNFLKLTFAHKLLLLSLPFLLSAGILHFMHEDESSFSPESEAAMISERLAREVFDLQRQMIPVLEWFEQNPGFRFTRINQLSGHPLFVYRSGSLVYWSDYRFVPDYRMIRGEYQYRFLQVQRKAFVVRRWKIANTELEVFALLPVYRGYKIENDFVSSTYNEDIFPNQRVRIHDISAEEGRPVCVGENNCLFRVTFPDDYFRPGKSAGKWVNILYTIGFAFLLAGFYLLVYAMGRKGLWFGLLLMLGGLLVIRFFMLWIGFPGNLTDSPLFDSRYFASSGFNRSLGDLLINLSCLCLVCLYLFRNHREAFSVEKMSGLSGPVRLWLGALVAGSGLLMFHVKYLIFQTLYHNSHITFDINRSLEFDGNRITGFIIFLVFMVSIFFIFHSVYVVLHRLFPQRGRLVLAFGLGAFMFSLVNLFLQQIFWPALLVGSGVFVVLRITKLPASVAKLRYTTFLYFFVYVIGGALLGAISIYRFENEREVELKKKFASQLLIENDNLGEFLLSEASDKIRQDLFIQSRMSSPFLTKEIVKAKIRQVYLSSYFNKYDIRIYLYNSAGRSLETTSEGLSPAEIQRFDAANYKTSYDGIYFINNIGGDVSKRYINFIEIKKRGVTVGYVIIDLTLKRIIPESVYPELLVDHRFLTPYQNANYSYAVYEDSRVTYSSGDFNYLLDFDRNLLDDPRIYRQTLMNSGYWHIAVKEVNNRVIVISSNDHPFSDIVSNFSFLFLVQVFAVLVITGLYALYFSLQNESLNYSAKIQLYLNIAFFLPLFAVSATTLSLINSSFESEVNYEYYKKAERISTNVSEDLNNYVNNISADPEELRTELAQISKFSGADVNLFNTAGRLIASSQPLIYENDLLSSYINPVAYAHIRERGENSHIQRESVGRLNYNTTFFAVKSFDKGELIGIVSIPYFQSEYNLEQSQITVLSNVINVFTVVFIVFLIVSYMAAEWLTFPLRFITQKLKKTTLTGMNEPLSWDADDEIGLMVGEYNRMLDNLEDSKKALSRSEKESAWREIAQQVAHEIKNPLTPMKLTLQHLNRKLVAREEEEMNRPINTLLQQVQTLDDIASSFSSFAKMPIPEHERYELVHVVRNAVSLHSSAKNVSIDLQIQSEPVYTVGDEQLMGRIINNLLLNAMQAMERDKKKICVILMKAGGSMVRLEVKDNGMGIAEEIHNKIFIPNFSTKETGSGIGLAIAKHGVEHAGGKIWFETETGRGTSFFIELPAED